MLASIRLRSKVFATRLLAAVPSCCALCGCSGASVLCTPCRQRYLAPPAPRCVQCAMTLPAGAGTTLCGGCLRHPPAFDAAIVVTDYEAPLDQLVLNLKFGAQLALAPLFGALLAQAMRAHPRESWPGVLAPAPLGRQRLAERGFNQALEIGRPLARELGLALARLEQVRGQHVGVIDDVITTGVTLNEIAATLKRAGAARVTCLAFARTPRR